MNAFTTVDRSPLSFLEWKIVEMAREDGPRSLKPDGLVARLARLFGMTVTDGLANEKQEALRRFSVRAWHWDFVRASDMRAFFAAGYSRNHALEILSRISMTRGFMPTIENDAERPPARFKSSDCHCG